MRETIHNGATPPVHFQSQLRRAEAFGFPETEI
jgi:hypothetical protein